MTQLCNAPHMAHHSEAAWKDAQNAVLLWSQGYWWHLRNMMELARAQLELLQSAFGPGRAEEFRAWTCGAAGALPPGWLINPGDPLEDILLGCQLMDDGFGSSFFEQEDHLGDVYA